MTATMSPRQETSLEGRLARSLSGEPSSLPQVCATAPIDRADRFRTLLHIYDLLLGPLPEEGADARLATHPAVTGLKWRLENQWLEELSEYASAVDGVSEANAVEGMRILAARDRLPKVYKWLAKEADREQLAAFVQAEGGPDGGFDDLVACAAMGLSGEAKLELARNYWDEMGSGVAEGAHSELHRQTLAALGVPNPIESAAMTTSGLERAALGGLLASNHWLQPEMLGALGMVELQAGPRCKLVVNAMTRLRMPDEAIRFYQTQARVDPKHGTDWLTLVVRPTLRKKPAWHHRVLRGARWRLSVNDVFLDELHERLVSGAYVPARRAA